MLNLGKQIENSKNNNLNAIRLLLALFVIVSHSVVLSWGVGHVNPSAPLNIWTYHLEGLGTVAVDLFFFISGMLITASWLRSNSMQDYLMSRVLRIYPGFIAAVSFSGIIVLIFCPDFRSQIGHGISWLLVMAQDWLYLTYASLQQKGIFENNPYPNMANGSLWTIQIEFCCYLLVAVIGLFCLFKKRLIILLAGLAPLLIYSRVLLKGGDALHSNSRFLTFFALGMIAWLWRDKIPFSKWIAFASCVLLLAASQFKPWFSILLIPCGGYCVLWLGYGLELTFLKWTRKTDISYGTYLYAWPIQQLVAMHESLRNPWINFLIAAPVTLLIASASWFLVEKRFLAMKHLPRKDFDPGQIPEAIKPSHI